MNKELNDALVVAINNIHPEVVEYLLSKGADSNTHIFGKSLLKRLNEYYGNYDDMNNVDKIVKSLIKYGAKE